MSTVSENDSHNQKHRCIWDLGLLVDLPQDSCKEESEKHKEDSLGSTLIVLLSSVFTSIWSDELFAVFVAYKVHNQRNIYNLIKSYQEYL